MDGHFRSFNPLFMRGNLLPYCQMLIVYRQMLSFFVISGESFIHVHPPYVSVPFLICHLMKLEQITAHRPLIAMFYTGLMKNKAFLLSSTTTHAT